ncbi:MAG TPA: hypothetical protein VI588_02290 [Candidatus Gracilibacteria bacterium]|nr:hypothetical protein [Candidatus Gracilibacteria bacterium]
MLIITLLSIIILLSIVFLLNTSQSFQQGIVFQQEQMKKNQLELQSRELVSKIIEAMSSKKVEQSDIVKNMEKPANPIYIPKEEKEE